MPDANPWTPMTDIKDLQVLGKLIEETTECASAASRCIIQGINETEPSTNKLNRKWLEDEIADVEANIKLTKEHFRLAEHRIRERSAFKEDYLRKWHNL